jgi:hypothetical protein
MLRTSGLLGCQGPRQPNFLFFLSSALATTGVKRVLFNRLAGHLKKERFNVQPFFEHHNIMNRGDL